MPLIAIPNQPLFPNRRPTDILSCDQRQYCHPHIPTDKLMAQFKQTPCNDSIVCDSRFLSLGNGDNEVIPDPDFSLLEVDQIINGTFGGNADNWTLQTGWAYGSGKVTKSATGGTVSIAQTLQSSLIQTGIYEVKFTISNYGGSGTVQAAIGLGAGASFGTQVSANGTYTQYIKCGASNASFEIFGTAAFTGDIDNVSLKQIASSWTFGFWYINGSRQAVSVPGPGSRNLTCLGIITQPNTDYVVEIDFDASTSGGFEVLVGNNFSNFTSSSGGTISLTVNSGNSGNNFAVVPSPTATLVINSISVKTTIASGECWTFDNTKWLLSNEKLCKLIGFSDTLTNSTPVDANTYYQFKITVSGRTSGSITPTVGNDLGQLINTNGTFTQYFLPTASGFLSIFADSTFDGCVSVVLLFELKRDYIFKLLDLDGNEVANVTPKYYRDFVTVNTQMDDLEDGGDPIAFGCYQLHAFDQCELQYQEIIGDGRMDNAYGKYWVNAVTGGFGALDISGGEMIFDYTGTTGPGQLIGVVNCRQGAPLCQKIDPLIPVGPHNYRAEFDVIENTDPDNFKVTVSMRPNVVYEPSYPPGHYVVDYPNFDPTSFYNAPDDNFIYIIGIPVRFVGLAAGRIRIDNVTLRRIEPYDSSYVSECIIYGESFKDTKLVSAECDSEQMGFLFYNIEDGTEVFKLVQRLYLRAINSNYPEDADDYLFSNGTKSRNYGKSEKSYTLLTDAIDETSIDALAKQRICQRFFIGEIGDMKEWISLPADLVPEWLKNGDSTLAPVRFEIQEKIEGAKFFRNS